MTKLTVLFFSTLIFVVNCTGQNSDQLDVINDSPCVFSNPVISGADPWVFKKDGYYYYIESQNDAIYVSKTKNLTDIGKDLQKVWATPDEGWNATNLWAPELHYAEGNWYIYYTAGQAGPPFIYQRSGVLRSVTDDALGEYEDRGMLYTGNNIETGQDNIWAIDLTILDKEGHFYAVWSGWEENKDDHRTPQHLYIAEMENPWTVSSNRVKISSPEEYWEEGSELAINEGPQILKNNEHIFIIYSASESWLPAYNLGQLRLKSGNADPMDPESWVKDGPVFEGTGEVYGVGHAGFNLSPDESENWILYHTKVSPDPGWDRVVHMQPFTWNQDGSPHFGMPVLPGEELVKPSGECGE